MRSTMCRTLVLVIMLTLIAGGTVAAEPDEDKPAATPAKEQATEQDPKTESAAQDSGTVTLGKSEASAQTPRPKSLSGLASGISLNLPKDDSGSVVISNDNLRTMGQGATVTEANNSMDLSAAGGDDEPDAAAEKRKGEIKKTRAEIDALKEKIEAVKAANEQNRAVNTYNGSGAHYRAGGQVNPLEAQQQELQNELAQAQEKLKNLENSRNRANQRRPSPRRDEPDGDGASDG